MQFGCEASVPVQDAQPRLVNPSPVSLLEPGIGTPWPRQTEHRMVFPSLRSLQKGNACLLNMILRRFLASRMPNCSKDKSIVNIRWSTAEHGLAPLHEKGNVWRLHASSEATWPNADMLDLKRIIPQNCPTVSHLLVLWHESSQAARDQLLGPFAFLCSFLSQRKRRIVDLVPTTYRTAIYQT